MRQLRLDEKVEFTLSPRVSIRIYADCRPHVLQTAKLQKGAILVCNGRELVEEGLGICVPVCRYSDGTRFSLSADTFVNDSESVPSVTKVYDMNGIASKRFRGVKIRRGGYAKRFLRLLEKPYRGIRRLQVGATMMLDLLSTMGMRNEYLESSSKGRIAVTYEPSKGGLQINVNFDSMVAEGLQNLVLGNEQGGRLFTDYGDSSEVRLKGRQIEPWRATSAEWATLRCPEIGVGFGLHRPSGWQIVRGREVVEGRMSWSGLNLVCDRLPKTVKYRVEILGDVTSD